MKKSCIMLGATAGAIVLLMTSCGTTQSAAAGGIAQEARASTNENNVSVAARETKIVDWQDRTIGAKVNPEWLLSIVRGNGNLYCQMYGISEEYANHKWFVVSASHRALANAQTEAENEVLQRLGQEMANTVNSTIGTNLTDGQKDSIRTICSKVNNVKLTGVAPRGTYWQLERTKDEYGNIENRYNYYALYSCDRKIYNQLLNTYMIELLKSKDLDPTAANEIKKHAQEILNDAQEQSARMEKAKEREWKMQLVHEETLRQAMREETSRQNTKTLANSGADKIEMSSSQSGNAQMDPALAALIGEM